MSAALVLSLLGTVDSAARDASTTPATDTLDKTVVTGSRVSPRLVSDSQTRIDVVSGMELSSVGQPQLQTALKVLVPSFSVSAPATAGALDFKSSPTLRGLP